MKKYYHVTPLDKVRSISNVGLMPSDEESNKLNCDSENKVSFSEGMTGVVAKYANCQKHYNLIKSGVVGGVQEDVAQRVKTTKTMQEYLGEGVYILFDGESVENEKNFMDGETDKQIDSENLTVCILKNNETGEVTYSRFNIVHYMMSMVPVETINYTGVDTSEDKIPKKIEVIRQDVSNYIKEHEAEINKYKYGNYTLENIPVKSFCTQYLFQKGDSMSGQLVGKATMDLLKDVDAVREMEAQLDRAVRELVRGLDDVEQDHTLIPKEREELKKDTN